MNTRLAPVLALSLSLFALPAAALEVRSKSGQVMDVEVLAYTKSSGNVKIKRLSDGQVFNVKIDVFAPESQEAIAEAAPVRIPNLNVDVSVGRRRAREGDSSYMKKQEITVTIKAENESRDIDLAKTKFTVLLIARNMLRYSRENADTARILLKEDFSQALPAGKDLEYECQPVITSYDSDRDDTNLGGWEYDGYLLVLQDEKGKVVKSYSNIGPIEVETMKSEEALKNAIALSAGREVQRNLRPLSGPGSTR